MTRLTRPLQTIMLLILLGCCLSVMTACAPKTVVVPDSREVISLEKGSESRPGWFGISGGYLRDLFRDCGKAAGGK